MPVEVILDSEAISERFVFEPFSFRLSELMICGVIEGYVVELAILHHRMLHNLKSYFYPLGLTFPSDVEPFAAYCRPSSISETRWLIFILRDRDRFINS